MVELVVLFFLFADVEDGGKVESQLVYHVEKHEEYDIDETEQTVDCVRGVNERGDG